MQKFLKSLGITKIGYYNKSGVYSIDIDDSDEYGRVYSKFDKCDEVEEIEDESTTNMHSSEIIFVSDMYKFVLLADWDYDSYKLMCIENKGEE